MESYIVILLLLVCLYFSFVVDPMQMLEVILFCSIIREGRYFIQFYITIIKSNWKSLKKK